MLTLAELEELVATGEIDTVVVAFTDMQGRLLGKRLHAEFFLDETKAGHAIEGCNYLLALEMEMDPVPGYAIASWEQGYGDFAITPDLATLRRIPWLEGTALILGDVGWHDGAPVQPSPRQVLRAQIARAEELGLTPMLGSELEFFLVKETYAEAHAKGYTGLTPSVPYILDYHILATTYDEPLMRALRNGMQAAGMRVETSKGEAWPGQQELNFRFADALTMADNHAIYKNGAKEIAFLHGCAITFMAKPFEDWIGNSCHIHSSLFRGEEAAFATDDVALRPLARRADRVREGARGLLRADDQLVQAVRGRELGADDARVGERQPDVRVPRRRARERAPGGDPDPRRRRQPVPRLRGADRIRSARHRAGARGAAAARRATRTSRTRSASPRRCARPSRRSRAGRWRGAPSAIRSSTTTSTTRAPSRGSLTASSPTGNGRATSSGSERVAGPPAKRMLDVAVSGSLLVLLAPVWAVVLGATGIAMLRCPRDRGSLFYGERRISAGRAFRLLKLRTLREDVLAGAAGHARPLEGDLANLTWAGRRLLKPMYLDELPQLVNVLRGDMSLVGPRPWPAELVERQLARGVDYRMRVPAGWTGVAQVSKGLDVSFEQLDVDYVDLLERGSAREIVRRDLGILARTVRTMLRGEGLAY